MSEELKMPFLQHLNDLRFRLMRALIGITIGLTITLNWGGELFAFLTQPMRLHFATDFAGGQLIGTAPADAFIVKLKISLLAGLLLSLPYTFFQIWKFIEPGLHRHEKRLAIPFVIATTFFFLSGAGFAFFVVLPFALGFFLGEYQSIQVAANIRMDDYLSFVMTMILVFGIVFELPVISFFLARFGIINSKMLIHHWRGAIVGIFIIAAVLSPPDVFSQVCLALPMMVLYTLCILVARFVERNALAKPPIIPATTELSATERGKQVSL